MGSIKDLFIISYYLLLSFLTPTCFPYKGGRVGQKIIELKKVFKIRYTFWREDYKTGVICKKVSYKQSYG